jgi:hypothetical protein
MGTVFSAGSAPKLYNEDPRPAGMRIEGVSWDGSRRWLRRDDNESVELQECGCKKIINVCWGYSKTGIITVLKSVARIRLVKTGTLVLVCVCNGELQSVYISDSAVLLVVTSWVYKCNQLNHPIQIRPNSLTTNTRDNMVRPKYCDCTF